MKTKLINIYLHYIRFFAKMQLKKINPLIIGIGGASGKTSTTLLIGKVLSSKFSVKESKGKNSETGIPLNILDIDVKNYTILEWIKILFLAPVKLLTDFKKYDIFVLEMGIDSPKPPKNMEYLLGIVKPKIGTLTNIALEHSFNFDNLAIEKIDTKRKEEILTLTAKEEGLLLKSINEKGISIVNLDDKNISNLLPLKSKIITISARNKNADFYISNLSIGIKGFEVSFDFLKDKYNFKILKPLPKYYAYSFLITIAVSFACKVSVKDSIRLIEQNFSLPPGRFSVFEGIKDSLIFDSSYNSSLEAATGAIEAVTEIAKNQRKVGILGDMRELGTLSRLQHELLAKAILKNLDYVILIGPLVSEYIAPILKKENFKFKNFETFEESKELLVDEIKNGDFILVKGSQNTLFLERVVEILLKNKTDVVSLPRRGDFWNKKRRA